MISNWMDGVESDIVRLTAHPYAGTPVGDVLDWAVASKGKRIRPMLLILCSQYGPGHEESRNRLTLLAAMTEITHLASLIHDDIVDEAPLRRDRQSVQRRFGKDAAVYAGDFLIARVHYFQAQEKLHESGMILADAIGQMCAGEIGQARCRYREDVTMQEYLCNIRGKTTALFRAACRIGATESGCSPAVIEQLDKFGETLGCLFQFRDDLLDFTTDRAELGKETHKDFRDGIYTLPVILAMRNPEAREKLLPLMQENRAGELGCEQIREMETIVREFGGTDAAAGEIRRYGQHCKEILSGLPANEASAMLAKIVNKCMQV